MASDKWRIDYSYDHMKDNPCKRDCPERSAECRITCERFAEYHEKQKAAKAERDKKKQQITEYNNYKYEVKSKIRKHINL